MRILCCNIRKKLAEDEASGNGWDARKDFCTEVMLAQRADVICIQECFNDQYKDLVCGMPEFGSFGISNPGEEFDPGNVIFYSRDRFDMVTAGGFWLSETPHIAGSASWDSARPRFTNYVQLKDRKLGREFRVWNAHFDHIGQLAREKQAHCLVEASQVFPKSFPQIFAADCNADASNPAINVLKAGGWIDTYTAVHGPGDPGFTFHAFKGTKYVEGRAPDKIKGKIDFVFSRGPLKVLDAGIIDDSRDDRYPSDHYFLSIDVEFG